ncbi:MAG: SUMF1/EgtB/PvdO family nonheme iron enzyme [Victivallales bacterium]|nr:SUMF1/EgtB/PvdO family nonheme iron enzyme [Victivallales bacterium]
MQAGDIFAGCRIICVCGTGAYGTVYLAEDALGRRVALKVFHAVSPDEKVLEALRRYAELPASTGILVKILHFGVEDGHLFYLMEAADNASDEKGKYIADTLALRLQRKGRLELDEALSIYRQLLEGMAALHRLGLVHRDIKPANIFYVHGKVKLGDPDLLNDYSRTLSVAGSLGFIPPEFLTAKQPKTPVGDIYALGKTFYCTVTGEEPDAYPHYPADLSADTLYRIVLPLSKICNRNPEMRAGSCNECLELMSPERNADASRWRQFLTKMALSRRYRNCAIAIAFIVLVFVAMAGYGTANGLSYMKQAYAEAKANAAARCERMQKLMPGLELQLTKEQHENIKKQFQQAEKYLEGGRRKAFNNKLDNIEAQLRQMAENAVPPQGNDFASVANMLGFLASPLGKACLDRNMQDKLGDAARKNAKALTVEYSPSLGQDFKNPTHLTNQQFRMVFLPPGKFVSTVPLVANSKTKVNTIEYPFWIYDKEVSNEIFNQILGLDYVVGEGQSMPSTKISWYEIIHFCQQWTEHLRSHYSLPKGYALRPPTEAEWEYAAMGGWGGVQPEERTVPKAIHPVYEGKPNALGIYDMDDNCAEYTLAGTSVDTPKVMVRGANALFNGKTGISRRSAVGRDVLKLPGTSFRVVLAPTPDDFFQKQFAMPPVEVRTAVVNGRHFAAMSTYYATNQKTMLDLAATLGAQLYEPASMDEMTKVLKALKIYNGFPAFLGAHYENGKWLRYSDGLPLELSGLPVPKNDDFSALCVWNGKCKEYKPDFALPTLLFEWKKEEVWQRRAEGIKKGTAPGIKAQFTVQGRTFTLLAGTLAAYACPAYCSIFGARPAILSDEKLRDNVIAYINSLGLECPVAIGATKTGRKWLWLDNSPVFPDKNEPVLETVKVNFRFTDKHVIPVMVIYGGKLMSSRETEMMLLEFP